MPEKGTLTIACRETPQDIFGIERGSVAKLWWARMTTQGGTSYIALDAEDMRTLFNWLGVELHRLRD